LARVRKRATSSGFRPSYKRHWEVPGGYVEPGESPLTACVREVREELGLALTIGRLLVVDWAPAEGEGDKLLIVFDGGTLTADQLAGVRLHEAELVEYAFHDLAGADELLIPRLSRRLAQALAARSEGRPRYLEHGATPWTAAPTAPDA
jgi:8-oxo-dGTP pyrophosphatase MutT (NUDIX family)